MFKTVNVKLQPSLKGEQAEQTPKWMNQKTINNILIKLENRKKRIGTLFSKLYNQFMIRRNYASFFNGFKKKILAKILELTSIQFINKFIFERLINNIKAQII